MADIVQEGAIQRAKAEAEWARLQRSASVETQPPLSQPYEAANIRGPWFSAWRSSIQSPDREWLGVRDFTTARVRDQVRNDPIANAALARRKNSAIGAGWKLSSRPLHKALGITFEQAQDLASQIQTEWKQYAFGYAFTVDAERKLTFGQILRLCVSHVMLDGEALGLVEWAAAEPTRYKTRLRVVDPDRLSNPNGQPNDDYFRAGVEHNVNGIPWRYWIRERHPADYGNSASLVWNPWTRWTDWGRPQVVHAFEPQRAEQSRGVSRFVTALKSFRSLGKFTDATLQNAVINALMVMFIQSSAGPEAVSENLAVKDVQQFEHLRQEHYDESPVVAGGEARAITLPYGDEVKMATASRDVASFDGFTRSILRMVASSLGVTYEELAMDYSNTNYSSARAAMIHAWAETQDLMALIEAQIVKPFFVAWLEEAFDRGYVTAPAGAPDFLDAPDAYAQAMWIGPGRGIIDPVKEALASAARMEGRTSTAQDENAALGHDWEETFEQLAREDIKAQELGLGSAVQADAQSIQDTKNPAKTAPDPSNDQGQPAPPPAARARAGSPSVLQRLSRAYRDWADAA
jgi:lambda family phage portal protein